MHNFLMAVSTLMLALVFQLSSILWAGSAVSVLTQHNDSSRTGANLNETVLNTSNSARYTIGPAAIWAENHGPFQGTFERALAGSIGNYVVFPGLIENRFVVTGTPGPSFDQAKRAPINGIQIVAREK